MLFRSRPATLPPYVKWEVPAGEVDQALADAMDTFIVRRVYCDPPLWQSEIDEWVRLYGPELILRYPTGRTKMMAAVERFRTDLVAGAIPHTGDPTLTEHVLNAQVREARGGYWLEKSKTGTAGHIDAAVAAVLAYEARSDMLAVVEDDREAVFL